jgi:sRNA-binding carbon storage regulator CsrA
VSALVLSVRVGESIVIGEDLVSLRSIDRDEQTAIIRVNGGQPLTISAAEAVSYRENISVGISNGEFETKSSGQRCRLRISAPKDVPILRQAILGVED